MHQARKNIWAYGSERWGGLGKIRLMLLQSILANVALNSKQQHFLRQTLCLPLKHEAIIVTWISVIPVLDSVVKSYHFSCVALALLFPLHVINLPLEQASVAYGYWFSSSSLSRHRTDLLNHLWSVISTLRSEYSHSAICADNLVPINTDTLWNSNKCNTTGLVLNA